MTSAAGAPQGDDRIRARAARDAGVALVLGSLLIVGSVAKYTFDARESLSARAWPQADGVVIDTGVERRFTYTSVRGATRQVDIYEPVVTYRYSVDGRPLFSRRVWLNDRTWNTEQKAQRVLDTYSKGTRVAVHYRPGAPNDAYLVANLPPWHVFILTFVGACMVAWAVAIRRSQARGAVPGRTRRAPPAHAVSREGLDPLVANLEALARGDVPIEHYGRIVPSSPRPDGTYNAPYAEYTPAMDQLWATFDAAGMQVTSDEYNAWLAREEPPLDSVDQVAALDREELRLRLFAIRRRERFVDGLWLDMLRQGVFLAFARRLAELRA